MATAIDACIIDQCRAEYSENILPSKSTFEDTITITKTGGAAFSTAVQSTEQSFDGEKCIKMYVDDNITPLSFNFGSELETTTTKDTDYNFSIRVMHNMPVVQYFPDELRIFIFLNGINTYEFVVNDVNQIMKPDKWYTFGQTINIASGVDVDFTYMLTTNPTKPLGTATMFMDGFKLESDERNLGLPSIYSRSKYFCCSDDKGYLTETGTGWETCVDTLHVVGAPQTVAEGVTDLLSNNKGTIFNSQLPTGVTTFFDVATTKITPDLQDDYMITSLMFKAKNSIANGYFTVFIDIPTLGERFIETHLCPKDANTETGFDITIGHFVSAQFKTNGGIIKVKADKGNLSIYDKQFRFSRIHKAV